MSECTSTDYPEYYRCDSTKIPVTCAKTGNLYETDEFVIPNTPYKIKMDWAICNVDDNYLHTFLRVYKNNILIDGKEFSMLDGTNSFDNGNLCVDMIMSNCVNKYSEYLIQSINPSPSSLGKMILYGSIGLAGLYIITKK